MSLACLVCRSVDSPSPSHSFRSYSVSSHENEGRCSVIANCLAKKSSLPLPRNPFPPPSSSKVMPHPTVSTDNGMPGAPRLIRSRAVRRDIVRDWNFEDISS